MRPAPEGHADALLVAEARLTLLDWVQRFLAALEHVEGEEEASVSAELQGLLGDLAEIKRRIDATPKLRPQAAAWRTVEMIVASYDELVAHYFGALTGATPREARERGDLAQEVIDRCATLLHQRGAIADASDEIATTDFAGEFGDVVAGAEAAFALSGAENILTFDQSGASLYERITGASDCPTGLGAWLQVVAISVESVLDPDRFWRMAAETYETLVHHKEAFRVLARDPLWREQIAAVAVEARDAGFESAAMAANPANRRRELRSAIRLGHVTVERLAPPHLATMLAVMRRTEYGRESRKEIRTLRDEMAQVGFAESVDGIDLALRDADAHNKFVVDDSGVHFTSTRREYDFLADEQLVDRVLLAFESVMALNVGITVALSEVGVDEAELVALLTRDVTHTDRVRMVLALSGWTSIEVELDGTTLRANGRRLSPTPTGLAATLLPVLPADIEHLVLVIHDPDGIVRIAQGPLDAYRRWSSATEPEKSAAFIEANANWRLDGAPLLSPETVRKLVAGSVLETFGEETPHRDALLALRRLLDLASRVGDDGLREVVTNAMALRRGAATGAHVSVDVQRLRSSLEQWATADTPGIVDTW